MAWSWLEQNVASSSGAPPCPPLSGCSSSSPPRPSPCMLPKKVGRADGNLLPVNKSLSIHTSTLFIKAVTSLHYNELLLTEWIRCVHDNSRLCNEVHKYLHSEPLLPGKVNRQWLGRGWDVGSPGPLDIAGCICFVGCMPLDGWDEKRAGEWCLRRGHSI